MVKKRKKNIPNSRHRRKMVFGIVSSIIIGVLITESSNKNIQINFQKNSPLDWCSVPCCSDRDFTWKKGDQQLKHPNARMQLGSPREIHYQKSTATASWQKTTFNLRCNFTVLNTTAGHQRKKQLLWWFMWHGAKGFHAVVSICWWIVNEKPWGETLNTISLK